MNLEKTCDCEKLSDEEKLKYIDEVIEDYEAKESSLIQILHIAQSLYGYLPLNVQEHIANKMDLPLSKVSGVISFYALFTTVPKGKYVIKVCLGTACYVRGGKKIIDRLKNIIGIEIGETTEDMKYSLEITRCIGACGLAPAIAINDDVHMQVNPDKLLDILDDYE